MERLAPPLPSFVSLRDVLDIQWTANDAELGELEERLQTKTGIAFVHLRQSWDLLGLL
jgi:hypothetical protein